MAENKGGNRDGKKLYKNVFEPVFIVENPEDVAARGAEEPNVAIREDTLFHVYQRAIVELIESGVSLEAAVEKIKPPEGVVDDDLREKCLKIETAMEAALLRSIQTSAMEKWQAAAWLLERRFPERWAKQPPKAKDSLFVEFDPIYSEQPGPPALFSSEDED
jgi:hypothetical protein